VGKTIISRIDGKEARITLGTAGKLVWRSSAGSGNGFWWTENGRVCDRYDPSGDFPGRGAGCRSFEQRGGDYYAGGKPVNFAELMLVAVSGLPADQAEHGCDHA
jgi:hypothetical protein